MGPYKKTIPSSPKKTIPSPPKKGVPLSPSRDNEDEEDRESFKSEPELENLYKESFKQKYCSNYKYLMDNPTAMDLLMLKELAPSFYSDKEKAILDKIEHVDLVAHVFIPDEIYGMMNYDMNMELYENIFENTPLVEIGFVQLEEEGNKKYVTGIIELDFDKKLDKYYLEEISQARNALFKAAADAEDFADKNMYQGAEISKDVNHIDRFDSDISDIFHLAKIVSSRYKKSIEDFKQKQKSKSPLVRQVQNYLQERQQTCAITGGKKKDRRKTSKEHPKKKKIKRRTAKKRKRTYL